jgi:hypothetical protein
MASNKKKWVTRLSLVGALVVPPILVVLFHNWRVQNWFTDAIRMVFVPPFWREGPPWFLLGLYLLFALVYLALRNWRYALTVVVLPIVCAWLLTLVLFAYAETDIRNRDVTTSTTQATSASDWREWGIPTSSPGMAPQGRTATQVIDIQERRFVEVAGL